MKAPWTCPVCGREVPSNVPACDHGAEYRRGLEAAAKRCEWRLSLYEANAKVFAELQLPGSAEEESLQASAVRGVVDGLRSMMALPPAQEQA